MRCIALAIALMATVLAAGSFHLLACSSDDAAAADSGGRICPVSVNDNKATFASIGAAETCQTIADQLNAPTSDDAGSECNAEGIRYELREIDGHCEAEAAVSCDGANLVIACLVATGGDADCTAKLTAAGIPPCDYKLTLRR